jgi:hypothetical protein
VKVLRKGGEEVMRLILLVVSLTVLLLFVSLAGTAFAKVPPRAGCEGLDEAVEQLKTLPHPHPHPGFEVVEHEVRHAHICL